MAKFCSREPGRVKPGLAWPILEAYKALMEDEPNLILAILRPLLQLGFALFILDILWEAFLGWIRSRGRR